MWSKNYSKCIECAGTDSKHMAKGLCSRCYSKQYRNDPKNHERISKSKREWHLKNMTPEKQKRKREQDWFDGKREKILERDGYRCSECGESQQSKLTVHHIDGNGRGSESPNNNDDNLITLCRSCHAKIHHTLDRWAQKYDCCEICGTTKIPHNARGLCIRCYTEVANEIQKI